MWIFSFVRRQVEEAAGKPVERSAFVKYKIVIWLYFGAWIALGLYLLLNWNELSPLFSWPLAALEGILAPDTSIFRRLFEGYDSYTTRALRGDF